ncbi:MAG TPA: NUDIX hydrolase [Anaerolineales bacterium]|jgi:ADP-ribose pyrophosphatase|nr:NUDIX hydrolase [Anaerolineales bacterium]
MEKWIAKHEIHKGKIFSLLGGKVLLDNGETAVREYIQHPGGVAIVPVVENNVILIRQFRITIEREVIELPAGLLESGEEPMDSASRELEEEIGYRAGQLIPLASYFSSVGFADERIHIFLALELEKTALKRQADERIQEVILPLDDIRKKLAAQEFEDAKTIIGLREYLAYLEGTRRN